MHDFIRDHFDKLLITFLILIAEGLVIFFVMKHVDMEVITWGMELVSGFVGALLGLVTGVAIGKSMVATTKNNDNETKATTSEETKS
jgi:hypothetical protein